MLSKLSYFGTTLMAMASCSVCRLTMAKFFFKVSGVLKGVKGFKGFFKGFNKIYLILSMFDEWNKRHPTQISIAIEQFSVDWSNRTVGPVKSGM